MYKLKMLKEEYITVKEYKRYLDELIEKGHGDKVLMIELYENENNIKIVPLVSSFIGNLIDANNKDKIDVIYLSNSIENSSTNMAITVNLDKI